MKTKVILLVLVCLSFFQEAKAQEGFIGEIRMFAGNFPPRNWAFCDGQLLQINDFAALYSLLGPIYGGDGRTTFALPDLRGRVAIHPGQGPGLSPYQRGQVGGSEQNYLTVDQLPSHSHGVNAVSTDGNTNVPSGALPANTKLLDKEYSNGDANTTMKSGMIQNTGSNQPVNNIQPYGTVNYIICLQGEYPSRQ